MFKLTLLIKAHNLIVIDCAIDFILQVFNSSDAFFTIISNALNRVAIDQWGGQGISIHYTFSNKTALCVGCSVFKVKQQTLVRRASVSDSRSTPIPPKVNAIYGMRRAPRHPHMLRRRDASAFSFVSGFMRANTNAGRQRRAGSIRETAVTFTDCDEVYFRGRPAGLMTFGDAQ